MGNPGHLSGWAYPRGPQLHSYTKTGVSEFFFSLLGLSNGGKGGPNAVRCPFGSGVAVCRLVFVCWGWDAKTACGMARRVNPCSVWQSHRRLTVGAIVLCRDEVVIPREGNWWSC